MRKHNDNTDSSKQHGENNALNPQTKGTDTTITTEPAKRNATSLWLHSLRRSTKIPSSKASAEGEDEPQRQSIRPKERWQSIHQKARPVRGGKAST